MFIIRFIKALIKWIYSGRKTRTKKEISEIYDICKKCPYFMQDKGYIKGYDKCMVCGCNLHGTKKKLNKIAWKTEKCPLDPPKWK